MNTVKDNIRHKIHMLRMENRGEIKNASEIRELRRKLAVMEGNWVQRVKRKPVAQGGNTPEQCLKKIREYFGGGK